MNKPSFKVVIPARYGSMRFPGKVLADLHGRAVIEHVHARARSSGASEVIVATDDERVAAAAAGFGARVCMTAQTHASGSDRIAEVAEQLQWADGEIVVNVQGDEPFVPPENIAQLAANIAAADAPMATLVTRFESRRELENPNTVKVTVDRDGYALYFSRSVIPFDRDGAYDFGSDLYRRHVGLYAYRVGFLKRFTGLPPAPLETVEKLEQLRALWLGERIHVAEAAVKPPHGVDTPEDLEDLLASVPE